MKVLLASSNTVVTPYPVYPLGMGVVAAALRRAGHDVAMFDLLAAGGSMQAWRAALREHGPALVGISIRNIDHANMLSPRQRYIDAVKEMVAVVRAESAAPVVLGGCGYSLMPDVLLREIGADYGVAGEGERAAVELAEAVQRGAAPPLGAVIRKGRHVPPAEIGAAAYDAAILKTYLDGGTIAPVQTKRGCNLRCAYCSYPVLEGGAFRCRPAGSVVDDVESLHKEHGVSYVFFTDSVFNDDGGAYLEVVEELRRRKLGVSWSAFLKPTGINEKAAALMVESGLAAVELGSDAATDATLRGLNKPFRFEDVQRSSEVLMKAGAAVAHYFMFGGPGETRQTLLEGVANMARLNCTAAFVFFGIRILPGAALHHLAIEQGLVDPAADLLAPVYYISPEIDADWAHRALVEGFAPLHRVVFPPDALDDKIRLLHKLGYNGSLWKLLGPTP